MAQHRHKREPNARLARLHSVPRPRAATIAGPLAVLATAGVVSLGVLGADVRTASFVAGPVVGDDTATTAVAVAGAQRRPSLSRGASLRGAGSAGDAAPATPRGSSAGTLAGTAAGTPAADTKLAKVLAPTAVRLAIAGADTKRWTTESLNLWTEPGTKASKTGELDAGVPVFVTGRTLYGRVEIVFEKTETRWVTMGYLTDQKPFSLGGSCTNGTSVASGVSENIQKVHAAVCAAFPDITIYGTFRGDGEHAQGIAVDIMVSGDEGYAVADFVRKYYQELGVSYVIYSQRIWSVQRSGEGWRPMSDRGSTTANHYDHVHVTTY